ncbi:MAG: DUF4249 domain-containing protein [Cyclobacteriaceae bacterium]
MKLAFTIARTSIFLLLVGTVSCLEEISFDLETDEPQLVVEGFINDLTESYTVRLSTTSATSGLGINTLGQKAFVEIEEIGGTSVQLIEAIPGTYTTMPGQIIGEVGKSYRLNIRLANNQEYQSKIETIPSPIRILDGDVVENAEFVFLYGTEITTGHDINVEVENGDELQYFILSTIGWTRVRIEQGDCIPGSGIGPPFCWSKRDPIRTDQLVIGSNFGQEQNYKLQAVKSIPVDTKTEYVAIVRTNAMSRENYQFFESINDQLDRKGTPFDRPFAPIIGNIIATNSNEVALGYFHAYATFEKAVCFDRAGVTAFVPTSPAACGISCVDYWAPASLDNIPALFCN